MKLLIKHILIGLSLISFISVPAVGQIVSLNLDHLDSLIIADSFNISDYNEVEDFSDSITFGYHFDYVPDEPNELIEDRLSCIENEIEFTFNSQVRSFIDYFTIKNRDYTKQVAALQTKYFPMIEKYLVKYGLPDELKYLAIVESGLNPKARSRAGAVGLWQFMPLTGRMDYGLSENWYLDEKMDMEKSTDAACRYLSFLYRYFNNNWHLALAAYNTGPGNVRKAIRHSGYKKTFWEIYPYLYRETRSYVPQFIAIAYTMNYLEEHNLFIDKMEYMPEYDEITVSGFLSLDLFAEHSGICLETLNDLNPELRHAVIPENQTIYQLRIPSDKKDSILLQLNEISKLASQGKEHFDRFARNETGSTYGRQKLVYKVQNGDVLGKIANRYQVRTTDLQEWNNMKGTVIRVGQPLNIWIADDFYDKANKSLSQMSGVSPNQPQKVLKDREYKVLEGDTLWEISRKYDGLTVEKLKKMNNLDGNGIKPGQILKIG